MAEGRNGRLFLVLRNDTGAMEFDRPTFCVRAEVGPRKSDQANSKAWDGLPLDES